MNWSAIRAVLVLPGTALVLVPATLLVLSRNTPFAGQLVGSCHTTFWIAAISGGGGLAMIIWTISLFAKVGYGTLAPWNPPKRLVVRGPYRHVRNPMISGVLLLILAEALFFQSWLLAGWLVLFFLANAIYFPLVEEKGLENRFGEAYILYRKNVPRWIPRLLPWKEPPENLSNFEQ